MKAADIRKAFLDFFAEKQHRVVPSSSLIPYNDPTLLFTNAGMNQFKDTFLGKEKRDYRRAATSQKCMRVSGKHNDFEDVGRSHRHHTFFEMLGNFSFGDYFKRDATAFAWELVTGRFGLPKGQLLVTVYEQDDDAFETWANEVGVPRDRIYRFGEADNFWAMGDTGPCGPCSEIHFDYGKSPLGHADCDLSCSCGRYVELWNLVFMQFNRDESGQLTPLPSPSIDTGMGFERITTVLQGKSSNYDTDLFRPILDFIAEITSTEYGEDESRSISMRIIADHSRAAAFLVADGQYPGNDKRGYVLRKILRRAIIHGRKLGLQEPFLYRVAGQVGSLMQDAYPELAVHRDTIARAIQGEEESFAHTLSSGLKEFNERADSLQAKNQKVFPGGEAFFLYDTRGLPLETLRELGRERDLVVDEAGFELELEKQRRRSRETAGAGKAAVGQEIEYHGTTLYLGHDSHETDGAAIQAIFVGGREVPYLEQGQRAVVVLDKTPFYAESGGQVGDRGHINANGSRARVEDTRYLGPMAIGHSVIMEQGQLQTGQKTAARVDMELRLPTQSNHTATHLLHAALRRVLGEHVKQAGSLVAPDRLRFDFSHYAALTPEEILAVERLANEHVFRDHSVRRIPMKLEEALKTGAMALFGEKYQDVVTVVEAGDFSRELCGGCHVRSTGQIGVLKIVSESSIAAGIRRIEAVTGPKALERFQQSEALLAQIAERLKTSREELLPVLERTETQLREWQRQAQDLQTKLARQSVGNILDKAREVGGVRVLATRVENIAKTALRELADSLRNQLKSGVVILGSSQDGKASLVIMVSADLQAKLNAARLIREIAPLIGGGGGGKPDMAEAGGKAPEKLDQALDYSYEVIARLLG